MAKQLQDLSEVEIIKIIVEGRLPKTDEILVDNGDDAAVWRVTAPEYFQVASTASLVQGVHFTALNENTGRKLMAVNLSDLASMGAVPQYAFLSVHFDGTTPLLEVEAMARGIHDRSQEFGVQLLGGNVTRTSGPAVLSVTLLGQAKNVLRRGAASVGDGIFVTGTLGDARAGLEVESGPLFQALVDPVPRVELGQALASSVGITSMCDVSDGLAADLRQLLSPADQGARVFAESLPISKGLRAHAGDKAVNYAVQGGEDYELLFSASDLEQVQAIAADFKTPITHIGEVTGGPRFEMLESGGEFSPMLGGFDHFSRS